MTRNEAYEQLGSIQKGTNRREARCCGNCKHFLYPTGDGCDARQGHCELVAIPDKFSWLRSVDVTEECDLFAREE